MHDTYRGFDNRQIHLLLLEITHGTEVQYIEIHWYGQPPLKDPQEADKWIISSQCGCRWLTSVTLAKPGITRFLAERRVRSCAKV